MSLVTTISGANSDSYVTLAEADAYINAQAYATEWAAFTSSAEREKLLRLAARRLDQERYKGVRATDTQRLRWPRIGVPDPDGYGSTDWGFYEDILSSNTIPQVIKDAQCQLALELAKANFLEDDTGLNGLKRVALPGDFEVEFTGGAESGELVSSVRRLIADLLIEDSVIVLRS